ncbi:MAG: VOC family protein [Actinomycetota bacterium]
MAQNPPEGYARITPYLLYEDVAGALDWLARAFGFQERMRFADKDGTITHAEMTYADGAIMLGFPGPDYRSPKRLGQATLIVHLYVEDVDEHFAQAKGQGATIISELEDQTYGDRRYIAEDPEGHRWTFSQHVRDVAPGEW